MRFGIEFEKALLKWMHHGPLASIGYSLYDSRSKHTLSRTRSTFVPSPRPQNEDPVHISVLLHKHSRNMSGLIVDINASRRVGLVGHEVEVHLMLTDNAATAR